MDFGGFILFGCIALVFLTYIPFVIFAYIRKNPKIRLHIAFVVAIAGVLIASGLFLRQVYFLDEPLAIAASQGDISTVLIGPRSFSQCRRCRRNIDSLN